MNAGEYLLCSCLFLTISQNLQAATQQNRTREEVARHSVRSNCWIIVDDEVYDITPAMKDHDKYKYQLDAWCGKDASKAWHTKDGKNKPHSRKAQNMLNGLGIGKVSDD